MTAPPDMGSVRCWVCPSCGAWVSVDSSTCPGCGHSSPSTHAPSSSATEIRTETRTVRRIKFLVQGSKEEPYETVFDKEGDWVSATCSCPAGVKGPAGQCCKHRTRILRGDTGGIVSANIGDVKIVQGWIAGSDTEIVVQRLSEGEADLERARKKIAAAKKALAKVMSK
jgi:hypothetical protein